MTTPPVAGEPAWAITDNALAVVLHAESDIAALASARNPGSATELRYPQRARAFVSFERTGWARESAVMRMITAVESYTDAASDVCLRHRNLPTRTKTLWSWDERQKYFKATHGIAIDSLATWEEVNAGIDLRNSLAHGFGQLTDRLLNEPNLFGQQKKIHVDVHGGRLHMRSTTVPVLAESCRRFVRDLENELVATI